MCLNVVPSYLILHFLKLFHGNLSSSFFMHRHNLGTYFCAGNGNVIPIFRKDTYDHNTIVEN